MQVQEDLIAQYQALDTEVQPVVAAEDQDLAAEDHALATRVQQAVAAEDQDLAAEDQALAPKFLAAEDQTLAAEDQDLTAEDQQILVAKDKVRATEVKQVLSAEVLAREEDHGLQAVQVQPVSPIQQNLIEEDSGLATEDDQAVLTASTTGITIAHRERDISLACSMGTNITESVEMLNTDIEEEIATNADTLEHTH